MEDHGREVHNNFGTISGRARFVADNSKMPPAEPVLPAKLVQVMEGIKDMDLHQPPEQHEVRGTYQDALRDFAILLHYIAPGIPVVDEIRARWVQ